MLFILATPIGNPMDITQRCQQILNRVDFVVCEELKNGSKLLKRWKIEKELLELNEHNEILAAEKIVTKLKKKQTAALISDAGTPVFLDPGTFLLRLCYQNKIPITSVAGACSLSLALSLVPFEMSSFHFGGFLDRNSLLRKKQILGFKKLRCPLVLYDTPYRLKFLLADLHQILNPKTEIFLAMNLTKKDEELFVGNLAQLKQRSLQKKEFVLVVNFGKS